MLKKVSWCADLKAESDLRKMSVSWDVKKIPFSKINLIESQVNGARLGEPLVRPLIDDYKQGFLNGDTFPRSITWPSPSGYVLLSGNQRCAALSELITEKKVDKNLEIDSYVITESDKLTREIIARSGNVGHGGRCPKEERLAHAVYCCRSLGMNATDAEKIFMVSASSIREHISAEKERQALMSAGIDASRAPVNLLSALGKLDYDQRVKENVATLAITHDVPAEKIRTVVATMAKQKSSPERVARLKEFERDLSRQSRALSHKSNGNGHATKTPKRPRREKLLGMLNRLVDFCEHGNDGQAFSTLDDLQFVGREDTKRITELCNKLKLRFKVWKV